MVSAQLPSLLLDIFVMQCRWSLPCLPYFWPPYRLVGWVEVTALLKVSIALTGRSPGAVQSYGGTGEPLHTSLRR